MIPGGNSEEETIETNNVGDLFDWIGSIRGKDNCAGKAPIEVGCDNPDARLHWRLQSFWARPQGQSSISRGRGPENSRGV